MLDYWINMYIRRSDMQAIRRFVSIDNADEASTEHSGRGQLVTFTNSPFYFSCFFSSTICNNIISFERTLFTLQCAINTNQYMESYV